MLSHISNHSKVISRFVSSSSRCFFRRLFCWKRSSELRFSLWKALVALECRWGCGPMLRATLTSALLISAVAVDELTKAAAKGVRGNCKDSGVQWSRGVKHGLHLVPPHRCRVVAVAHCGNIRNERRGSLQVSTYDFWSQISYHTVSSI